MTNPNMRLWDKVKTTNPRWTKDYKGAGGFEGTAVNAHYRYQMATEQFGPVGMGWGYDPVENKIEAGVWFVRVELWYMLDGIRGVVTQWGGTKLVEKRGGQDGKPSYDFVDTDAPKKSITDAVTKCLSMLGFNADVHMGKYDDENYYEWAKEKFAREEREAREAAAAAKSAPQAAVQAAAGTVAVPAAAAGNAAPTANAQAASEASAAAPPANLTTAPAGSSALTPRQQANVWFLKLRKLNEPLAMSLNGKDLPDADRCQRIGAELANCLWAAITDRDKANKITTDHKGNLPAAIDALLAAMEAQGKKL